MAGIRSLYKDDVDFAVLALQSPSFNTHLKSNGQLDFSDPKAVQQLTKSLLQRDFNLELDLPGDRLCPPVPNRLNYVFWMQDLLDTTGNDFYDGYDPIREVVGLDIGTGSSCIYPLLSCSLRQNWKFAATDIDEKNIQYARQNILQNNFKSRIRPVLTRPNDPLIYLDVFGLKTIDFTICNPPFYSSPIDLLTSAAAKSRPPNSACTGAEVEMVTPGGEVAFVTRMIEESLTLKTRCQWYTSMLGKLSSVSVLVNRLQSAGVQNWAIKEFVQGGKTRRWAIAWSFRGLRPKQDVARGIHGLPKHLLPFPPEYTFHVPEASPHNSAERLTTIFNSLDISWDYRPSTATAIGFAKGNVWSRAVRRQREKKALGIKTYSEAEGDDDNRMDDDEDNEDEEELALGFTIQFNTGQDKGSTDVQIRWVQGLDSVLFESFCGMLKRKLTTL